jgi:hypothetical protein
MFSWSLNPVHSEYSALAQMHGTIEKALEE